MLEHKALEQHTALGTQERMVLEQHKALGTQEHKASGKVVGSILAVVGKVVGSKSLVGMVAGMDEHMVLGMQDDKVILVVYNIYRRCRRP